MENKIKKETPEGLYEFVCFDSLNELCEVIDNGYKSKKFKCQDQHYNKTFKDENNNDDWTFGEEAKNTSELRERMQGGLGSESTLAHLEKMRFAALNNEALQDTLRMAESSKRRRVFQEDGSELNIDRLMGGDYVHWEKMTKGKKKAVMRIAFNAAISASFGSEEFSRVVSYGLLASEVLEKAGYSTEIQALFLTANPCENTKYGGAVVNLKNANEPLDIHKLSTVGLSGVFRAYCFSVWTELMTNKWCEGYGLCIGLNDEAKSLINADVLIDTSWSESSMIIHLNNILKFN